MIKKLKPSEYQDHLCDEIVLVLLRLKESYSVHVAEVYLDIKAVSVEIYVDGHLPEDALSRLKQECRDIPALRFNERWVACTEHYCSVESAKRDEGRSASGKSATLWYRLRRLVAG